ncbi:MAG: sulfatase [Acidobacteria bacterium]|nr:sulfatase [Acidobacteriota bacterium]
MLAYSMELNLFPKRLARSEDILKLSLCFGLATGLCEGAILLGLQEASLAAWPMIRDGVAPPILWISPAFDALLFLTFGAVWASAAAFARRDLRAWAAGFFGWMGSYSLLASTGRLKESASIVLGLGMGALVGRQFARDTEKRLRIVRRALLPIVTGLALLLGAGVHQAEREERASEERLYEKLPAAVPGAPNVLLIVLDAVRADHLSAQGYPRATSPNIERLAREGTLYLSAYSTSSWSLPAHASLITGLFPFEHRADLWPLRPEFVTLAEFLSARGYMTASFAANTLWCTSAAGFTHGFAHHEEYFANVPDMISRTLFGRKAMKPALAAAGEYRELNRKTAATVNQEMLAWLDQRQLQTVRRPFFVFLNYFDAHEPAFPPAPYDGIFAPAGQINGRRPIDFKGSPPGSVPREAAQAQVDAYDSAIAYMDAQLGALWAELERRGLAGNTLLIVTSDHGEALGEQGWFGHRGSLRAELIHVPLLVRLPWRVPAGARPETPVSLQRVAATIADVAGLESGAPFAGSSLAVASGARGAGELIEPVLAEVRGIPGGKMPEYWPLAQGDLRALVTQRWHFIERNDGHVELYDRTGDPRLERNLAGTMEGRAVVEEFRRQLARLGGTPVADAAQHAKK